MPTLTDTTLQQALCSTMAHAKEINILVTILIVTPCISSIYLISIPTDAHT